MTGARGRLEERRGLRVPALVEQRLEELLGSGRGVGEVTVLADTG